ncbi:hypothetical protein ACJX0J_041759, partial [Zea mays]
PVLATTALMLGCIEAVHEGAEHHEATHRCGCLNQVVQEKKVLEVHVEKGMQHNQKITFPGEADEAPDTITGDIVFVLQQKDNSKFKRKGEDLFYEHTLSLTEALCGFQFVLTHLDNRQLLIKSDPGFLQYRMSKGHYQPIKSHTVSHIGNVKLSMLSFMDENNELVESETDVYAIADFINDLTTQLAKAQAMHQSVKHAATEAGRWSTPTAPSPEVKVYAYAAAQVKKALEVTHYLCGENYVFLLSKRKLCVSSPPRWRGGGVCAWRPQESGSGSDGGGDSGYWRPTVFAAFAGAQVACALRRRFADLLRSPEVRHLDALTKMGSFWFEGSESFATFHILAAIGNVFSAPYVCSSALFSGNG